MCKAVGLIVNKGGRRDEGVVMGECSGQEGGIVAGPSPGPEFPPPPPPPNRHPGQYHPHARVSYHPHPTPRPTHPWLRSIRFFKQTRSIFHKPTFTLFPNHEKTTRNSRFFPHYLHVKSPWIIDRSLILSSSQMRPIPEPHS